MLPPRKRAMMHGLGKLFLFLVTEVARCIGAPNEATRVGHKDGGQRHTGLAKNPGGNVQSSGLPPFWMCCWKIKNPVKSYDNDMKPYEIIWQWYIMFEDRNGKCFCCGLWPHNVCNMTCWRSTLTTSLQQPLRLFIQKSHEANVGTTSSVKEKGLLQQALLRVDPGSVELLVLGRVSSSISSFISTHEWHLGWNSCHWAKSDHENVMPTFWIWMVWSEASWKFRTSGS